MSTTKERSFLEYRTVELDGVRYVILRESLFERLCKLGQVDCGFASGDTTAPAAGLDLDRASLAERLVLRRRAAGLSQIELARRAGVRPETLNRIERGRTTPDFATVRKLVVAMNAIDQELAQHQLHPQEKADVDQP
jgi:DNA-binding XRE family transcriptional regulator